jgi:hypothetical protein
MASGADKSGMGQWVWTLFPENNNIKLHVLSRYQPNPNPNDYVPPQRLTLNDPHVVNKI